MTYEVTCEGVRSLGQCFFPLPLPFAADKVLKECWLLATLIRVRES